ncbi:MAG: cell division protein FtsQ/DivIB [Methylococcaceae bacterium]
MRAAKNGLWVLLFIGLIWVVGYEIGTRLPPVKLVSLPIKYVRVEGVFRYLNKDEVKTALLPLVTTGFFDADMQAIKLAVGMLPWVETVTVKRIWPDSIDIKVTEKIPYTRWGKDSLITEQGVIFTPSSIEQFKNLTILSGPERQQLKVLEMMKGIKTTLADQSIELAEFNINDRGAWKIIVSTGLEIVLGRNEQLKKLQRFLKTLTVLGQEQVEAMAAVDLRYPNGYAVSWKPETLAFDWQSIANPGNEINEHTR